MVGVMLGILYKVNVFDQRKDVLVEEMNQPNDCEDYFLVHGDLRCCEGYMFRYNGESRIYGIVGRLENVIERKEDLLIRLNLGEKGEMDVLVFRFGQNWPFFLKIQKEKDLLVDRFDFVHSFTKKEQVQAFLREREGKLLHVSLLKSLEESGIDALDLSLVESNIECNKTILSKLDDFSGFSPCLPYSSEIALYED